MMNYMRQWWMEREGLTHEDWIQWQRRQRAPSTRRPQRRDTRPRAAIIAFRAPRERPEGEGDMDEGTLVVLGDRINVNRVDVDDVPWGNAEEEGPIAPVHACERNHRARIIEYARKYANSGRSEPEI